jgi:hypothetical protein
MTLTDYQISISRQACTLLKDYGIAYLCMEVRTGKTFTAFAAADKFGAQNVLFVTRKKAIADIKGQYGEFAPGFAITVTNYEQLKNIPDTFDLVIVDEAHSLGAFPQPSNRAEELQRICKNDTPVLYLSGTPSPESYSQLYHQFWISKRSPFSQWPTFHKWAKEFVDVRQKIINGVKFNDYSRADRDKIDALTAHLFISFTQEEAGFEAPVEEHVLYVDMKPSTMRLIEVLRRDKVYNGRDGKFVEAGTPVKLMQKIHQVCSGSVITDSGHGAEAFDDSKAKYIRDRFAGKKIAIFYKFVAEKYMIWWTFNSRITEDPEIFKTTDNVVFVSQIQSGREGINLSTADCIVFYNIDFSAVSYWQARARLQDRNRTRPAEVYWIFARGGIEEKIYQAVLDKKDYTVSHFKRDYETKGVSHPVRHTQEA